MLKFQNMILHDAMRSMSAIQFRVSNEPNALQEDAPEYKLSVFRLFSELFPEFKDGGDALPKFSPQCSLVLQLCSFPPFALPSSQQEQAACTADAITMHIN